MTITGTMRLPSIINPRIFLRKFGNRKSQDPKTVYPEDEQTLAGLDLFD
jgi:hypothetical protein